VACDNSDAAAADKAGGAAAQNGATKGGPPGAPGGAPGMMVVLGPNDVIEIRRGTIESSIAISGNLRPIEQIEVRARVDGNVTAVTAREGTRVGRGQVLARFEDATQESDRASAQADVESAQAEVGNAQWNADQSADLFKAGAIPERDLRAAQQELTAAKARLAAAEARLKAASQTLDDTRIVSPTSGVIEARTVEPGEHVARGTTLFTVVRSDVLELQASVPARQAGQIRSAQPVRFTSGTRNFTGRVARISPTINPQSRSLEFYVEVPNRDASIKGNTFVTGKVIGEVISDAVLVPTAAVRQAQTNSQPFVFAIVNGTVERRPVTLGIVDETVGLAQVAEGLAPGDRIVAGSVGTVGTGTKVTIVSDEQTAGANGAVRPSEPPPAAPRDSARKPQSEDSPR
jgi:RND family efflux transporter MFP subunit